MKIEHLQLRNFQSYESTSLDFSDGLTLIHGSNGAGKSTLLRAIFGGLFQTNATTETSSDYSLADLVARGEDEGAVLLSFSAGGSMYTVEWVISVTEDDDGERRGSTKSCSLTSSTLDTPIEGVRDVRAFITELIGMGAKEFANSVYVQQKRFSRLIEATGSERKEILDGLLGLDELDQYIQRTKRARRPVKRQRDDYQARLQEVRGRLAEYDEQSLLDRRKELNEQIEDQQERVSETQQYQQELSQKLESIKQDIDEHEDRIAERDELQEAIHDKEETIQTLRANIEAAKEDIDAARERINELEDDIEGTDVDYDISTAEAADNALESVRDDRDEAYELAQTAQMRVSTAKEDLTEAEENVTEAKKQLSEAEQNLDEAKQMIRQRLANTAVDVDTDRSVTDAVEDAVETWAADIEDATLDTVSTDAIDDVLQTLNARYDSLNDEVAEQQAAKSAVEDSISETKATIRELEDEYEKVEDVLETDDNPMEAYNESMETARSLASALDIEIDDEDILTVMEDELRDTADSLVDEYHELAVNDAVTDKLETKRDDLKTVHELTTALARALQYERLADVAADRDDAEQELEELESRHEKVTQKLETAEQQQDEVAEQRETGEALHTIVEQLDVLDEHREAVDEAEAELEEAQGAVTEAEAELENARETKQTAEETLEDVENTQETIRTVVDKYDEIADCRQEIGNKRDSIGQYNQRIQDLNDAIAADKERLETIESTLKADDMDGLKERKQRVERLLEKAEEEHSEAEQELSDLRDDLAAVNQDLDALEDEREREQELQSKAEEYDDLVEELTEMIEMYESVKVDLREQTLGLLNKYTNDVFNDLYENESYVGVTVDNDYNVRLVTGDGEEIDPDKCSGGEGVITNIALRAGVYRVISEQDETGGDMLPPFILDEPTNHLDDEHVSRIEDAIRSIQEWNVPQVFVVSHRESLVTSADHELYVEKDKATGNSTARFINDDD